MSHITGTDERVLARLVKRYGSANVIGETHEIAGKRRNPKRRRGSPREDWAVAQDVFGDYRVFKWDVASRGHIMGVVRLVKKFRTRQQAEKYAAQQNIVHGNPRRRVSRKAQRHISGKIRRLAHEGEPAKTRVAIAYRKARAKGYRVPRRRRANPTVGILTAGNPPHIVKELSRRTYDVAYKHSQDGGPYTHSFGRDVHISLLSDGNVLLWHPTRSIWRKFA